MSLFEELKRRNVVRVGIAYLVISWLVLQVADVVFGNIGAPDWLFPALLTIIGVGLPVVLVLAWIFELTPEGLKRDHEVPRDATAPGTSISRLNVVIIAALSMALAYFVLDKFLLSRAAPADTSAVTSESGQGATSSIGKSIVVLPFANRSVATDDAFFVDGMHDDILTQLSKLSTLDKVISRTTAISYANSAKPIGQIAEELGVATVLEGGVQRAGDTIRINMQLIDARTDKHLWAEIFERRMTVENLFAIQTEITREVVAALDGVLSEQDEKILEALPTESLQAYKQYTLGRQQLARRTAASLEQALAYFERAVELDPDYALAYVGIADVLTVQPEYAGVPLESTFARRREVIDKALAINPLSGEAYASLAALVDDEGKDDEAERYFLRAIELNPNYATTRHWYGMLLRDNDRVDEAIVQASKARDIDPAAPILAVNEAGMLATQGRVDEAALIIRDALKRNPEFPSLYRMQAQFYRVKGDPATALVWSDRAVELAPLAVDSRFFQCEVQRDLGMFAESVACAEGAAAELPGSHDGRINEARQAFAVAGKTLAALVSALEASADDSEDAVRGLAISRFLLGDRIGAGELLKQSDPERFDDDVTLAVGQADGIAVIAAAYFDAAGDPARADDIYAAVLAAAGETPAGLSRTNGFIPVAVAALRGNHELAAQRLRAAVEDNALADAWVLMAPVFEPESPSPEWRAALAALEQRAAQLRATYERQKDTPLIL